MRLVATGFAPPADTTAWAEALDYEFEIWTDADQVIADHYDVMVDWEEAPLRHAYILDAEGNALIFHEGAVSDGADPGRVYRDCEALFGE